MSRQIKFRGLRIDSDEWVYGCLVNNLWTYSENSLYPHQKVCEIITDQFSCDDYEEMEVNEQNVKVMPDSVGQFTGLKDKNGKDAYVGNIYKESMLDGAERFYRIFNVKGGFAINTFQDDFKEDSICFYSGLSDMQICSWFESCLEEIGNIHEHKHLL